jgi:hypothetical protein
LVDYRHRRIGFIRARTKDTNQTGIRSKHLSHGGDGVGRVSTGIDSNALQLVAKEPSCRVDCIDARKAACLFIRAKARIRASKWLDNCED